MFVKNKATIDFKYRKNGYLATLKAGEVSYVDDSKVCAKELRDCYGQRIDIISLDPVIQEGHRDKVETVKKEELNDSFIEKVLGEIEGKEPEINETRDLKDEISLLLNKELAAFLNGETDDLPEGTEIISNEEAEKLENAIKVVEKEGKAENKEKEGKAENKEKEDENKEKEGKAENKAPKTTAGNKATKATKAKTTARRSRAKKA